MIDVKNIMDDFFSASSEVEKSEIKAKIFSDFNKLSDSDKNVAREMFLNDFESRTRNAVEDIGISVKMLRVSKYVSLAYIANTYFGKSRQWLNNRMKGNLSHGKPAAFTRDEIKRLSAALVEISEEIKMTALQIAS